MAFLSYPPCQGPECSPCFLVGTRKGKCLGARIHHWYHHWAPMCFGIQSKLIPAAFWCQAATANVLELAPEVMAIWHPGIGTLLKALGRQSEVSFSGTQRRHVARQLLSHGTTPLVTLWPRLDLTKGFGPGPPGSPPLAVTLWSSITPSPHTCYWWQKGLDHLS